VQDEELELVNCRVGIWLGRKYSHLVQFLINKYIVLSIELSFQFMLCLWSSKDFFG